MITKPTLLEVNNYFFDKGNRQDKAVKQFCKYYDCIGWPENWKDKANQYLRIR